MGLAGAPLRGRLGVAVDHLTGPPAGTETTYNAGNYAIDAVFSASQAASLPRSAAPAAQA
jgi:hypothetical protein